MKKGIRKEIQEKKEDRETVTSEEKIKKVASYKLLRYKIQDTSCKIIQLPNLPIDRLKCKIER